MYRNTTHERILVIANETVESPILRDAITANLDSGGEVVIVAPMLNTRLRHWLSDEEEACMAAELRLARCVNSLAAEGIEAQGWVGDSDPLQAIADALHQAPAGLLIVSTHPEGRSNWLSRNLVERAHRRFGLAVVHIVIDHAARQEYVADRTLSLHRRQFRHERTTVLPGCTGLPEHWWFWLSESSPARRPAARSPPVRPARPG